MMPPMAMELKVDTDAEEVGFDADRLERIDRHFARYVEEGQLPGWLIVVTRRGRVAHLSRCGHADIEAIDSRVVVAAEYAPLQHDD